MPTIRPTRRPGRLAAFGALWKAVARGNRPGAPSLGERLRALPRMAGAAASGEYPGSRARLGLLVLALAYIVSPFDLVPEAVLSVFGLIDDAVVALWLGGAFLDETDRFVAWEADRRPPGPLR